MNIAELMVKCMKLDDDLVSKFTLHELPAGTTCAITGTPITSGYRAQEVVTSATGEFLDLLHGNITGHMSADAAKAFKGSWNMGAWLMFEDGTGYHPLISSDSAAKDAVRECWSDLVRAVWPERAGQLCAVILTTDFKKKIWPNAVVGALGAHTPILLYNNDTDTNRVVYVDWPRLLKVLNIVELVYSIGFSKNNISAGLYLDYKRFTETPGAAQAECVLEEIRWIDEFDVALLIAQKHEIAMPAKLDSPAKMTGGQLSFI